MTSIAALLTLAGYSINDTVVVFDRIRENLRRYKAADLKTLINLSVNRSEEHTSELQSLMRISYAVFCLKKKNKQPIHMYKYTCNKLHRSYLSKPLNTDTL